MNCPAGNSYLIYIKKKQLTANSYLEIVKFESAQSNTA